MNISAEECKEAIQLLDIEIQYIEKTFPGLALDLRKARQMTGRMAKTIYPVEFDSVEHTLPEIPAEKR